MHEFVCEILWEIYRMFLCEKRRYAADKITMNILWLFEDGNLET